MTTSKANKREELAHRSPILGVLGGMGPMATVDFLSKIIKITPATCDQEHIRLVVSANPKIPDRSNAILCGGRSPLPALRKELESLERLDVDLIAIPCNTAHYWFDDLQSRTCVPIIHIVDAVTAMLQPKKLKAGFIGVLATTGTVRARIYDDRLAAIGMECIYPNEHDQEILMSVIRSIKAHHSDGPHQLLSGIADKLRNRGAEALVMACTELPLCLPSHGNDDMMVDATEALALACVQHLRT